MQTIALPALRRAAPVSAPASPSPLRVGSLSLAISVNLFALLGLSLMRQSAPEPMPPAPPRSISVDIVPPPRPLVPPPPMPVSPARPLPREPVTRAAVVVPLEAPAWVSTQVEPVNEPIADPFAQVAPTVPTGSATSGPADARLRYLDAPQPRYPPLAHRRGQQGEVLLRVEVGTDGRPVSVEVERSSGHAVLDREARQHVLKRWRFEPARVDGELVTAWGLVPINFSLN